jgi:hypothetical protein
MPAGQPLANVVWCSADLCAPVGIGLSPVRTFCARFPYSVRVTGASGAVRKSTVFILVSVSY